MNARLVIRYYVVKYFIKLKLAKKAEEARKAKELADLKKKQANTSKSKSSYSSFSSKKKPVTAPPKPQNIVAKQQTIDIRTASGTLINKNNDAVERPGQAQQALPSVNENSELEQPNELLMPAITTD